MPKNYMIDYENVSMLGLEGYEHLTKKDKVDIFYSRLNKTISLDFFDKCLSEKDFHDVPVGDQSADKHLLAYLGLQIGGDKRRKYEYIVITKDKGFDNIIRYLIDKTGASIKRYESIEDSLGLKARVVKRVMKEENVSKQKPANHQQKVVKNSSTKKVEKKVDEDKSKQVTKNVKENKPLAKKESTKAITEKVNKTKHVKQKQPVNKPKTATESKPQNAAKLSSSEESKQKNHLIQKTLSGYKIPNEITNGVASIVTKFYKRKNSTEIIKTEIISKFGEKMGNDLINKIINLI